MSSRSPDAAVVGAGVVGLAVGYALAEAGLRVAVFERGDAAGEASKACNGALLLQTKQAGPHLSFAQRSLALFQGVEARLEADVGYRPHPGLTVAPEDERDSMLQLAAALREAGVQVEWHEGELTSLEPLLSPHLRCAISCAGEAHVHAWRLCLALASGIARAGGEVRLREPVLSLATSGARVVGVETARGAVAAGHTVVTAGLGCGSLLEPLGAPLWLTPVRGQALVTEALGPALGHVVLASSYAESKWGAARGELGLSLVVEQTVHGNLIIGSTRERGAGTTDTDLAALGAVARLASRYVPALQAVNVIRCFSGLRPTSADGLPLIGPVGDWEHLTVACGHGGDGVSLSLATGDLVRSLVLGGSDELLPAFSPGRFFCERQEGAGARRFPLD